MQNENNEILVIASLQHLGHLYIATCLGNLFRSCIDLGKKENIKKSCSDEQFVRKHS